MRSKVVKKVCLFAVMLAVLVSTVAFSASAFTFIPATGYGGAFLLINNVRMLPNSSTPLVVANMTNVNVSIPGTSYSRNFAALRLTVYPQGNGTINFVLDNPNDGYTFAIEAPYNDNTLYYYTTSTTHYSCSYALISYGTLSVVNQSYFDAITIYSADVIEQEGYEDGYDVGYGVGEDVGYQDGYTDGFGAGANADYQQGFEDGVNSIGNVGNSFIWSSVTCKVEWFEGGIVRGVSLDMDINNDTVSFPNATTTISQYCADQGISYPTWCYLVFTLVEDGSFIFDSASRIYVNGYPSPASLDISVTADADLGQESWMYLDYNTEQGYFYKTTSANVAVEEMRADVQSISALNQLRLTTNLRYDNLSFKAGYAEGYEDAIRGGDALSRDQIYQQGYEVGVEDGYQTGYDRGLELASNNNFRALVSTVIDVPFNAFRSLLNFNVLGINLMAFVTSLFTLCIVIIVIKKVI